MPGLFFWKINLAPFLESALVRALDFQLLAAGIGAVVVTIAAYVIQKLGNPLPAS